MIKQTNKKYAIFILLICLLYSILLCSCEKNSNEIILENKDIEVEETDNSGEFIGVWYDVEDINNTLKLKEDGTYTKGSEYGEYTMIFGQRLLDQEDYSYVNKIEFLTFDGESYLIEILDTEYGYGLGENGYGVMGCGEDSSKYTMLYLKSKKDAEMFLDIENERVNPTERNMIGKWYSQGHSADDPMDNKFMLNMDSDHTYSVKETENKNIIEKGSWSSFYNEDVLCISVEVFGTNKREGSYLAEKYIYYDPYNEQWNLSGGDTEWYWGRN